MSRFRWTPDLAQESAAKFQTRKAFELGDPRAYAYARRSGLLDAVCAHMGPCGPVNVEAPQWLYFYTHPDGYAYVGITNSPKRRQADHKDSKHNRIAKALAEKCEPSYFSRDGAPTTMSYTKAVRLERIVIRKMCRAGFRVANKSHNPQYRKIAGKDIYQWDKERKATWCPDHFRAPAAILSIIV